VARGLKKFQTLFACTGIFQIGSESFYQKTRVHTLRVNNVEGLEDDQLQTSCRGCGSVNGDCNPWNGTASRPRTGLTGFLPKLGCRLPVKGDIERYGIGTWRFVWQRASKAHLSEALP
jgi:hypothetical protein